MKTKTNSITSINSETKAEIMKILGDTILAHLNDKNSPLFPTEYNDKDLANSLRFIFVNAREENELLIATCLNSFLPKQVKSSLNTKEFKTILDNTILERREEIQSEIPRQEKGGYLLLYCRCFLGVIVIAGILLAVGTSIITGGLAAPLWVAISLVALASISLVGGCLLAICGFVIDSLDSETSPRPEERISRLDKLRTLDLSLIYSGGGFFSDAGVSTANNDNNDNSTTVPTSRNKHCR